MCAYFGYNRDDTALQELKKDDNHVSIVRAAINIAGAAALIGTISYFSSSKSSNGRRPNLSWLAQVDIWLILSILREHFIL